MSKRALLWGAVAVAAYLVAALLSFGAGLLPARVLYDGLAPPPPYNYVDPPRDLADTNIAPRPYEGQLTFDSEGSMPGSIATPDGQAFIIFRRAAIPAVEGQESVTIRLEPLSAADFPPAPGELVLDGNVYEMEMHYDPSGEPAELRGRASVVLRYPIHAEVIMLLEDGGWRTLETNVAPASFQLFADTPRLGAFAAAGIPEPPGRRWLMWALGGLAAGAAAAGYLTGRRRRAGKGEPSASKRKGGKKAKRAPAPKGRPRRKRR